MNEIPWQWQLALSFFAPIISAGAAYLVAWWTTKKAMQRHEKDIRTEELKQEKVNEESLKQRQRMAVIEAGRRFDGIHKTLLDKQLSVMCSGSSPDGDQLRFLGMAVLEFYRDMHSVLGELTVSVRDEKVTKVIDELRDYVSEEYSKIEDLKVKGADMWIIGAARSQPLTDELGMRITKILVYSGHYLN